MYLSGMSSTEIGKLANITSRSIRRIINRNEEKTRAGQPRIHNINELFFDEWTYDMAYILGFIMADGCISCNTLSISQKEKEILEEMKIKMSSGVINKRVNNKNNYLYNLVINSKYIVTVLREEYNITENKSITLKPPPNIPDKYLPHLIRGLFDGDGHVSKGGFTVVITTASQHIVNWLINIFKTKGFNTYIRNCSGVNALISRVVISGRNDVIAFGKWVYPIENIIYLDRKRIVIEQTK
jgi:hypothetical protein